MVSVPDTEDMSMEEPHDGGYGYGGDQYAIVTPKGEYPNKFQACLAENIDPQVLELRLLNNEDEEWARWYIRDQMPV